jgi:hypothetical protein
VDATLLRLRANLIMSRITLHSFILSTRPLRIKSKSIRAMSTYRVRKFAPLDPTVKPTPGVPKLEGIIFDVDGTLCISYSDSHMNSN